jgi:hypothetical protein
MKYFLALVLAVLAFSVGCSYGTKQTILQKEDSSSIRFVGEVKGTQVQIDSSDKITMTDNDGDTFNSWNPRRLYRITPGKHRVRVYRSDALIVDAIFFIGSNEIKEVSIP